MTIKRIADITASALLLLALAPFVLVVAIAIAVTMGAPVVFRQKRPGRHGKVFDMLKFRSMTDQVDANGELLPDSDRTTPLGQFLRDTSLDELPQLINVFLGEMSLVGPRPLLAKYTANCTPEQAHRFDARPGITGWAQIQGRKAVDYDRRFEYDVWYVRHQSLLLDLKILFATLRTVFRKDGIVEIDVVASEPRHRPTETVPALKTQLGTIAGD
jgi:sugar transferase EpsL